MKPLLCMVSFILSFASVSPAVMACPARSGRGDTVLGKTAIDTFGHKEELTLTQAPMRFGRHI